MTSRCTRYILWIIATCYLTDLTSQVGTPIRSAATQLSGGNSLLPLSNLGLYANPAGLLMQDNGIHGSISANDRFGTDIRSASGAMSWHTDREAYGILIGTYGISGFRQNQISASYSRLLSSSTRLGLSAHWYNLSIDELENQSDLDFTLGIQQDISETWSIGAHIYNPISKDKLNENNSGFALSTSGQLSAYLTLHASIYVPFDGKVSLRPGLHYKLFDAIELLWSMDSAPTSYNYGTLLNITDTWSLTLALNAHQQLGTSLYVETGITF